MSHGPHNHETDRGDTVPGRHDRAGAATNRQGAFLALLIGVVGVDAVIVIGIMLAVGAPIGLLIGLIAIMVLALAAAMWAIVRLMWAPLARRFPAQLILPDAASRSFQSVSLGGLSRFNNCVQITVDERHLHLALPPPLSWFGGDISIPWAALSDPRPSRSRGWMNATLGDRTMTGPDWCMSLIEPRVAEVESPQT